MTIAWDYRCRSCSAWQEKFFFTDEQVVESLACVCGGTAIRTWAKAPGLAGVSEPGTRGITRTFHPGYDVQSGKFFETRTERDGYLKARGLVGLGPDEYRRSASAATPQPDDIALPGIDKAMNEAYEEATSSRETAPIPQINESEAMIADGGTKDA